MQDITNALNSNKTVTIHEKTIYYKGFKGSGYAIVDNTTGAGAYLISGGANGGIFLITIGLMILSFLPYFAVSPVFLGFLATFALGITLAGFGLLTNNVSACDNGLDLALFSATQLAVLVSGGIIKKIRSFMKKAIDTVASDSQLSQVYQNILGAVGYILNGDAIDLYKNRICGGIPK